MKQYNEQLSYAIKENGYEIYLDGKIWIKQYEPNGKVYNPNGTYEENCLLQLEELSRPPIEPNNDYGIPNEVYNQIVDDTIYELIEQGVIA